MPRTKKSTTQSLFTSESCHSASKILSCASLRPAPPAVLFFKILSKSKSFKYQVRLLKTIHKFYIRV